MRLAWRLARRELRGGGAGNRRGLGLLLLCLFLGTAALAGIGSLSASIAAALDAQGRTALGGDLELRVSQRRATEEERAALAARGPLSETVRMRALAQGQGAPALVDLKAVDARWPLVGRFSVAPGALLARPHGLEAAIAPALAQRLGVHVGDTVRVGMARLRVIGLIAAEPDQLGEGFRLGLPMIVDPAALDATGLVQPGSLYESRYRLRLPAGADATALGRAFVAARPSAGWSARTATDATGSLRRGIDQLGQFLLLVGLAALAIAGIGIASGVDARLAAKTRPIATLKVLGADGRTVWAMLLLELAAVGAAGVGAGLIVGAAVPWIVSQVAGSALPVQPLVRLYPAPLGLAAGLALLVGLLAAVPALARAARVPAATLLRGAAFVAVRPGPRTLLVMVMLAGLLGALAVLTAADRRLALGFTGGTAAALAMLALVGWLLRRGLAWLPRPRGPLARLALANLHRPGAQTGRLVVALGFGFALFVGLAVIDTSLSHELRAAAPAKAPRFFAIDLQPEDVARFRHAIASAAPAARIEAVPSLRGAIVALNGRRIADMAHPPDSWLLRGDRNLTWSASVPQRNAVVAGRWWPANYRGPPLVSIGADAAETLGLHVGDTITVAVLGVEVPARIAALRRIDWGGLGLNFAMVFSPGYIEEAPHGLIASVYADPGRDGAIGAAVAEALPSVTLVRVGDIIGQVDALIGRITVAVRAAAAVTLVAGVAVLIGAVAASSRARSYDAVLLKLLGGTRGQVLGAQALEYAFLALLLALLALGIGTGAGWWIVTHLFKLAFAPDWRVVAATLAFACLLTLGVGLLGSLPALNRRPAEALRAE